MQLRQVHPGQFVLRPWDKTVSDVKITAAPSGAVLYEGPPIEQMFPLDVPKGQTAGVLTAAAG